MAVNLSRSVVLLRGWLTRTRECMRFLGCVVDLAVAGWNWGTRYPCALARLQFFRCYPAHFRDMGALSVLQE